MCDVTLRVWIANFAGHQGSRLDLIELYRQNS